MMGRSHDRRKAWISFCFVLIALPAAFAAENVVRVLFLAEQATAISSVFGDTMRRIAWISFGLTIVLGLVAAVLRESLRRRYNPGGAMMAGASIAQVPAILACAVGVLGADPLPVELTVGVASLFVAWHWPGPPQEER